MSHQQLRNERIARAKSIAVQAFLIGAIVILFARVSWGASLRICVTDNPSPDIASAPAFIDGNPLAPDLLAGSTLTGSKRCNVTPIPATLARGANATVTVKYANALGEVSAPSNGLSFRNPALPPVPNVTDVSVVSP